VILLSDGCANHGLLDHDRIHAQCAEFARAGVSTSTYGLGHGFNEELMIGMARHGQGSSYYGQTADDLMDPFREEFELLNALSARRLRLEIAPAAGVKAKMLNDYVADGDNAWLLPNLAFGGEAWAVIRLRIPSPVTAADAEAAALSLCSFSLRYTTLDGEPRAIQPMSLALPVLPASAFGAIAEDDLVVIVLHAHRGCAVRPLDAGAGHHHWHLRVFQKCDRVAHQRFVGAGYFDDVTQTVTAGTSSITAMKGSTEEAQFEI
jgi:Ca-activated chloride channel family protein